MSVYTLIEQDELEAFLQNYNVGTLTDFHGITAGIENTNYFVTTSNGRYVLTIFEQLSADELPYFLDLMAFLAEHEVPSAHPVADRNGHYLRQLKDKPAALVDRLNGAGVEQPNVAQCRALGAALGRLHAVGHQFTGRRENVRGPHWWHETAKALHGHLSSSERDLLDSELAFQDSHRHDELPTGVIHADLFRDNALFVGDELTGIIDFYYACNDVLIYDLAVTVNDWCSNGDGSLDAKRLAAMLGSYTSQRPLNDAEKSAWPVMLRAAALRFWLSRLLDKHFPKEGELTHIKDPEAFRRILQLRIEDVGSIHDCL
ncbi:homoserine kinase [Sulfuriflexus mobilis]|uniref:homoserine kinase n=1 Tax=Sulfuriflexus mobilis TaxID=1811807 RepID=UPI000F81D40B|nr:homoserine kinase [Sulfuriflexus mobilis]